MRFAVTILSSILLACSVTIANPVHSSATTDAEHDPLTIVSSTTASTEYDYLTVVPSSTTSTDSSPSSTPNTSDVDPSDSDSDSTPDGVDELLKRYSKKQKDYSNKGKECEFIELQYGNQKSLINRLEKKVADLKSKHQKNKIKLRFGGGREVKELEDRLKTGYPELSELEKKKKKCRLEQENIEYELDLIKLAMVGCIFTESPNTQSLNERFSRTISRPLVRDYIEAYEESSGCTDDFGQDPSEQQQNPSEEQQDPSEEQQNPSEEQQNPSEEQQDPSEQQQDSDIEQQQDPSEQQQDSDIEQQQDPSEQQQDSDIEQQQDPSEQQQDSDIEQQQDPSEQQQDPSGQRKSQNSRPSPKIQSKYNSFKQRASTFGQRVSAFGQRASTGIRSAFSRLGERVRLLIGRLRCDNKSEC
ncbi:hypothetical protein QVD99_006300 [Batrachochytrium dendrobatidis]|nr:hypothetical protein QVD99_006300 [Batrachochytrium dendrobatidis]